METEKLLYTLFIFGNFKGHGTKGEILQPILPITCNETLKFIYEPFTMLVQFDSDLPKDELAKYIKVTYGALDIEYVYLVPKGEETNLDLPQKIKKNLNDLENNSDRVEVITTINIKENETSMDDFHKLIQQFMGDKFDNVNFYTEDEHENIGFFMEDEDDDVDDMLKPKEYVPTLDNILDKILENGINSLTLQETTLLNKYSNDDK